KPLTLTRRLADGTQEPIAGLTARRDGTSGLGGRRLAVGEATSRACCDGDDRYGRSRASASLTMRRESALTPAGPPPGVVATALELAGVLTAGGEPPAPGATPTVRRTVYVDDVSEGRVTLPPVSVNADGTYAFTDTLASPGRYSYLARWSGEATA